MARPGAISCAHKDVLFLADSTEGQSIRLRRECCHYGQTEVGSPPERQSSSYARYLTVIVH
jgi:hypothetical protein